MPTERHTLSTGAWVDAGPTPCLVQLMTLASVAVAVGTEVPADDHAPAHVLSYAVAQEAVLALGMGGQRAYLRRIDAPRDRAPEVTVSRGAPGAEWASPPVERIPADETAIAADGVPQILFPAGRCLHGGTIVNLSDPGSGPLWVDVTGSLSPARSTAAVPVYPALDATSAPGAWRVPPTRGAVTIRGAAGSTFAGFSG